VLDLIKGSSSAPPISPFSFARRLRELDQTRWRTEQVGGELSYVKGASGTDLFDTTIGGYLDRVVASSKHRDALVSRHQGARYTYGELGAEVQTVARALLALGVRRGDRIAIWAGNCAEWLITQYASAKIGAILVGLNPAYRLRELEYVLRHAGVSVLIVARGFRDFDYFAALRRLLPELQSNSHDVSSDRFLQLRAVVHLGRERGARGLSWNDLLAQHRWAAPEMLRGREAETRPRDPAQIIYTSGTTGNPKGAMLSHRTLLNCGFFVGQRLEYQEEDRLCLPVPFYHVFGCILGALAAMTSGCAVVLPGDEFDAGECLKTIETEGCTAVYGVPTMFIAQLEHPYLPECQLHSLRTGIVAGAPCSHDLMRTIIERMHLPELTISYGLTESPPALQTAVHDSLERRVATVGTALPHVECKIIDPNESVVIPRGTPGELCTRGYGVMLGYWNDAAATAAVIDADGWMHTGDLAEMDDEGYVRIVGRLKDIIIRAGENVHPREVEDFLRAHPKVLEAHVFGLQDSEHGEEVCAWIKLRVGEKATAEEIRRFCRNQIASYKVPRYIRFVDSFPTTITGKVQKFRMREITAAEMAPQPTCGR
jgi:fatty-acyl-CoA synthase